MYPDTTIASVIEEILAVVGCEELHCFYRDFNLPPAIIDVPAPLSERAKQTLRMITSLTGNCFKAFEQTEKMFYEFLSRLGEAYSSETAEQFIDWVSRHGIDNNYYACLTLWDWTLGSFDGWARYRLLEHSQEELQKQVFAIYQRLLDANIILSRSWTEGRLKSIQDRLESLQARGRPDVFLERNSLSEQMTIIETIMYTERSYRFLMDLKCKSSEEEMNRIIDCAKMLGTNSGWSPPSLKELVYFQKRKRDNVN